MTKSDTTVLEGGSKLPANTPYTAILKMKNEKYLRGWMSIDKKYDPKGHAKRLAEYEKSKQ